MAKISYFWETSELLSVNGVRMTPEEAYAKYPDHKDEIQKFVEESKKESGKMTKATTAKKTQKMAEFHLIKEMSKQPKKSNKDITVR